MRFRAAVFTVSDSRSSGAAEDRGGPAVVEKLALCEAAPVHREIVPDDAERIRAAVQAWIGRVDLIITTGGTGVALRDVTPEALAPLIEKALPGFGEVMRLNAFARTPTSVLSRGGAGTAGATLIVWLPGSPKAVTECLTWLAPAIRHACRALRGDAGHGGNCG
jgi:molybdenum cofactor synthesis domain-containing protein